MINRKNGLLISGILLAGIAFARGDYLLGTAAGLMYALVTIAMLVMFTQPAPTRAARIWKFCLVPLAIPMVYAFSFPASINPRVQYVIDEHRQDRQVRADVKTIMTRDRRFADLSISSAHLKVLNVTISGTMNSKADLREFRTQLLKESDALKMCILHWDITIEDSDQVLQGLDQDLFKEDQELAGR